MNWDDPLERLRLIEEVGVEEYNRRIKEYQAKAVIETVNGHAIRKVQSSRWGTIYMVDGLNQGSSTLEGARKIAEAGK